MSEPYSAIAHVTIDRLQLTRYLDASPRQMGAWDDWGEVFSRREMSGVDADLGTGSYRRQIRKMLAKSASFGRFCRYTESNRTFTFGTFFYSDDIRDYAYFFAVARGLAPFLSPGSGGFAAIGRTLWNDVTFAIMDLAPQSSKFLATRDAQWQVHKRQMEREFEALKSVYAVESPVAIDHLDLVS